MKGECDRRHDNHAKTKILVVETRETLIELAGKSGRDGIVGELVKDMSSVQNTMKDVSKTMDTVQSKLDKQGVKIAGIVTVATIVGGAVVTTLFKLLF